MSVSPSRTKFRARARALTVTAMLSAISFVLMFLDFPVPFMPSFVQMDISELPALLAAFSLGPVYGVMVCLIKNLIHLLITSTAGAGELCNFLLGASFMLPAGLIYKLRKSRGGAILGALVGAVVMALVSIPLNYFITYPVYVVAYGMPLDVIIGMYQAIRPGVNGLLECLITFNAPFTLVKGLLDAVLCFLIYKPLSPLLHGRV
ncbi:ECF transporter S component [Pseudoflavonifractor phocaeensis]|uniref:ECF transporter S component n=1 Tax=Pseudoflavonifractor phocaeensis TaxID=1870988 RepID=UPI00195E7D13|nr:ECF transporter S component [Pseudoflavonifractor phocaeensis]MBM6869292.1 ECF transporter S component [Pseudoflavonifractor phocaeensis]MBM6937040.1 ECF transporter S component [Pseudoflavonifractor phocaeensis]